VADESGRSYTASDGRTWTFHRRPEVRQAELGTHVTLLVESLGEVRVVSCRHADWESAEPDLRALLARSVPLGGSRGVGGDGSRAGEA
jgi:hypothetical protein